MVTPIQISSLLLLLFAVFTDSLALTVQAGKAQFNQREAVTLTIEAAGRYQREALDLTPLNADFRLFNSRVQHYYQYPDWRSVWTVNLQATRAGTLTVPALALGSETSTAFPLLILSGDLYQKPPAILTVEVDHRQIYLQSQLLLTQTLYQRASVSNGILSEPKIPQAIVKRLEHDSTSQTTIDGMNYNVIKRRYAIFPQQSGHVTIPPSEFSGLIVNSNIIVSQSLLQPTNKISTESEGLEIDVLPIPAPFTERDWLATEQLSISAQWQQDSAFKTGEPKVQSITLRALGLFGTQLPELVLPHSVNFKYYLEEVSNKTEQSITGLVGEKVYHLTYIPLQVGNLTIPEIQKAWWSTKTNQRYTTTIPAQTITVLPGKIIQKRDQQQWVDSDSNQMLRVQDDSTSHSPVSFWYDVGQNLPPLEVVVAALIVLALLVMARHWYSPEKRQQLIVEVKEKVASRFAYNIKKGCQTHDSAYVYHQVLLWASSKWPDQQFNNLSAVDRQLKDAALARKFAKLNKVRFDATSGRWNGRSFWRVFKQQLKHSQQPVRLVRRQVQLPSLYHRAR